jgi:hypothetical protein
MREMWRFYWPVISEMPTRIMKAVHLTHSIVFLVGLVLLIAGLRWSDSLEWLGLVLLVVAWAAEFFVSVFEHHCDILANHVATKASAALKEKIERFLYACGQFIEKGSYEFQQQNAAIAPAQLQTSKEALISVGYELVGELSDANLVEPIVQLLDHASAFSESSELHFFIRDFAAVKIKLRALAVMAHQKPPVLAS